MKFLCVGVVTYGVLCAAEPKPDPMELPRIPHTPVAKARETFEVKPGLTCSWRQLSRWWRIRLYEF